MTTINEEIEYVIRGFGYLVNGYCEKHPRWITLSSLPGTTDIAEVQRRYDEWQSTQQHLDYCIVKRIITYQEEILSKPKE